MPNTLDECATIEQVAEFYETNTGDEDFDTDVVYRMAEISAETDENLDNSLSYRNMMIGADEYCEQLIGEINEAIAALDEAYDAEQWDQLTDDIFTDWESDEAMSDAAAEIDDVNNLLHDFKGYLNDIGESVTGLYGSDFDFGFGDMMNESFFGDFWGTEMNMNKIQQSQDEMVLLLNRIINAQEKFVDNLDDIETEIQDHVNGVWDDIAA